MNAEIILSGVVALSTMVYTWINWKMLNESKATRLLKTSPNIVPYLKSTDNHEMLSLHIKNMGEGCAKCVRIQLLKDYHVFHDPEKLLSNHQVFQEGINVFPSGYELHYNIDWWDYITGHGMDDYIELCVTCSDINGKEYGPQNYTLKFSQIRSCYSVPPETYMGQIAYYLKEIHKVLNNYYGINRT